MVRRNLKLYIGYQHDSWLDMLLLHNAREDTGMTIFREKKKKELLKMANSEN